MRYKHALAAGAAGLALILTGCANDSDDPATTSSTSTKSTFNKADTVFAQEMIPHHRQAIEMATLARTRAAEPDVKRLASDIETAQGPEITMMTGWLKTWKRKAPADMSGMSHRGSGSSMPGMMSQTDLAKLKKSTGAAFDQQFLTMMVAHHQGAIQMAQTEQSGGKNASAVDLAKKIEAAQTGEINSMQELLAS